jgi:hypothetical protein
VDVILRTTVLDYENLSQLVPILSLICMYLAFRQS